MASRSLTVQATWDDPGDLIKGNVNPFSLHFRFVVFSKDEKGQWQLRHDTGLSGITEYNDAGGKGWTDSFDTEYDDSDPNAVFYCQWITITSVTCQGGTVYNVDHSTIVDDVICNGTDEFTPYCSNWNVSAKV